MEKHSVSRLSYIPFRAPASSSFHIFCTSELLPCLNAFPSVHIVGSLASKLPSSKPLPTQAAEDSLPRSVRVMRQGAVARRFLAEFRLLFDRNLGKRLRAHLSAGWSVWAAPAKLKHQQLSNHAKTPCSFDTGGQTLLPAFPPWSESLLAQPSGAGAIFEVSLFVQNFCRQHGHEAGDAPGIDARTNSDQGAPKQVPCPMFLGCDIEADF